MKIHKLEVHKGLVCDECGYVYSDIRNWRQHKQRDHSGLFFCGNQTELQEDGGGCGKAFKREINMKTHIKICGKSRIFNVKSWDQLSTRGKEKRKYRDKKELERSKRELDKSKNCVTI